MKRTCLAVLACVLPIGALVFPDSAKEAKGLLNCRSIAKALGMKAGTPVATQPGFRGRGTTYQLGELMCTTDSSGKVIGLADMSSDRRRAGPHSIRSEREAIAAARMELKRADLALLDPVGVVPAHPWSKNVHAVNLTPMYRANGYPTSGYAGGPQPHLSLVTGKIISLRISEMFKPDPPRIRQSKAQAIAIAERLWKPRLPKPHKGRRFTAHASLQYFRARSDSLSAPAGAKYARLRRLRLCWSVSLWLHDGADKSPVTHAAIDAETGEVLAAPFARN